MTKMQKMRDDELGRFVCVAAGGCLHSRRVIDSDGVWVQHDGGNVSSAHRDCHENSVRDDRMTTGEVRRKIAALEDRILFLEQQIREKPWETYTDAELRHHNRIEH